MIQLTYAGLRSDLAELKKFYDEIEARGQFLNIHDSITGFQRGLIVIHDSTGIIRGYSVRAFFLSYDGELGAIRYGQEREWQKGEVTKRLRRGNIITIDTNLTEIGSLSPEAILFQRTKAFGLLKKQEEKASRIQEEIIARYLSVSQARIEPIENPDFKFPFAGIGYQQYLKRLDNRQPPLGIR